jgi:murein L,D-transpeptidase YcbB/YkuD
MAGTVLRAAVVLAVSVRVLGVPAAFADPDATAAVMQSLVDAGVDSDLRWPRFPDYQEQVRHAYGPGQFAPLWVGDGRPTAQATEVIATLAAADTKGLEPTDYDAAHLRAEAEALRTADAPTAEQVGRFDVALTVALIRFASDSYIGRINPHVLGYGLDIEPKKLDLPALVLELAHDPNPARALAALDPPIPVYAHLQEALTNYRGLGARTDLPAVPALPKLRPGGSDPGVPALRAWLTAYGDLSAGASVPAASTHYDAALVAAVKRFQRRHGLDPDGVIGAGTLHALQVPPAHRVRQIELAMERLRWLPYRFPDRFVLVNIPEFRLRGFEDSEPAPRVEMNVVVGSYAEKTETPVLHADMRYLIFRPFWLVPSSIAKKEIVPKADRDPAYLTRQNMEVVNGRFRQKPGPSNSLGLLKFIFPNPFHVYLHDTPSKALFQRSRRDFSHGCIRVSDPPALADFVLQGQPGWSRERIEAAMKSGPDNRRVDLQTPVPVYVFYTTVVVDPGGQIDFFDDIYGHDATLDALLAKGYPYP